MNFIFLFHYFRRLNLDHAMALKRNSFSLCSKSNDKASISFFFKNWYFVKETPECVFSGTTILLSWFQWLNFFYPHNLFFQLCNTHPTWMFPESCISNKTKHLFKKNIHTGFYSRSIRWTKLWTEKVQLCVNSREVWVA